MAEPVTAPGWAGFSLWVCTAKLCPVALGGPLSSTSTTCILVRLGQAGWSVSLAGPASAQTPNQLSSPEISHKHPNHAVEAQAGGSQGSCRHGVGVAGGKGAEPTDRAFIEHRARPAVVHCGQGSLKPETIGMCGHSDTEALEVRARVRGLRGLCRLPPVPGEPDRPSPGDLQLHPIC